MPISRLVKIAIAPKLSRELQKVFDQMKHCSMIVITSKIGIFVSDSMSLIKRDTLIVKDLIINLRDLEFNEICRDY